MANFKVEDFLPMPPHMGPPLPRFLVIYWPWYKEKPPVELLTLSSYATGYGGIEILQLDGKPFSEVNAAEKYVVLSEPTGKPSLDSTVCVTWKNVSLQFYDPEDWRDVQIRLKYKAAFPVEYPYDDAPQFLGKTKIPSRGAIETMCPDRWYGGWWAPGIYDGEFSWGLRWAGEPFADLKAHFTVKNMVRCTGSGHIEY